MTSPEQPEKRCGVVTPTLMLGPLGSADHLSKAVYLANAADAFTAIRSGFIAILPPGEWDMAAETLRLLGADEMVIADRLQVAQTGRVLYAV